MRERCGSICSRAFFPVPLFVERENEGLPPSSLTHTHTHFPISLPFVLRVIWVLRERGSALAHVHRRLAGPMLSRLQATRDADARARLLCLLTLDGKHDERDERSEQGNHQEPSSEPRTTCVREATTDTKRTTGGHSSPLPSQHVACNLGGSNRLQQLICQTVATSVAEEADCMLPCSLSHRLPHQQASGLIEADTDSQMAPKGLMTRVLFYDSRQDASST